MKKSEIIQLALIILGILIIIRTLETLTVQTSILFGYQDNNEAIMSWIFTMIGIFILMILAGYLIIRNSENLSKRIVQDESGDEKREVTILSRIDILTITIIIFSMYFIITGFVSFISSFITLFSAFFSDFLTFKEIVVTQLAMVVQYLLIIVIFFKAKDIASWIDRKILRAV